MSKHTPGPWRLSRHCKTLVEAANNRSICSAGGYADNRVDALDLDAENQANARLIAAAPELLDTVRSGEALIAGELVGAEWKKACYEWLFAARAAISEATGESP